MKNYILNNTLFNLSSGPIIIGNHSSMSHNSPLLTGTHEVERFDLERQISILTSGGCIIIESGVRIASNVTIVGPCKPGKDAVIAAGAVVPSDVPRATIFASVPRGRYPIYDRRIL